MVTALGLLQFGLISLGILCMNILVKAEREVPPLPEFLAKQGMWLYLIPLLWAIYASLSERVGRNSLPARIAQAVGVLLALGIVVCFMMGGNQVK